MPSKNPISGNMGGQGRAAACASALALGKYNDEDEDSSLGKDLEDHVNFDFGEDGGGKRASKNMGDTQQQSSRRSKRSHGVLDRVLGPPS